MGAPLGRGMTNFVLALTLLAAPQRHPVVEVVQRASPAVVSIGAESASPFGGSPLEELFGGVLGSNEPRRSEQSLGSGVVIDRSGLVITNEHVIRGAAAVHVLLEDGRKLAAEVVG